MTSISEFMLERYVRWASAACGMSREDARAAACEHWDWVAAWYEVRREHECEDARERRRLNERRGQELKPHVKKLKKWQEAAG